MSPHHEARIVGCWSPTMNEPVLALEPLISEVAQQFRSEFTLDSVLWGVIVDGSLVMSGNAGGHYDLSTRYRIASMTKSFTAAAVLSLRDEGILALDTPVAHYAPELAAISENTAGQQVSLRHLLSMSSGIATDDPWADRHLDISDSEIREIYELGVEFAFPTGTHFEYSNLGYAIIGSVVHRLTGRRLRDIVDERLLIPLNMSATTWDQPAPHTWASPTRIQDGVNIPDELEPLPDGNIAPMGGLWSTVEDLARWISWLDQANQGLETQTGRLSVTSRREMQTMHTYAGVTTLDGDVAPTGYGYGLMMRDDADLGMIISHSGGLPGYGSNMRWLPGRGVGVVAVSNTTYAPMSILTQRILKIFQAASLISPAFVEVSPLLHARAGELVMLINHWNNDVAHDIFADNVDLDESLARREQAARVLLDTCGHLIIESIVATSRAAGTIHVRGPLGEKKIEFQLAPIRSGPIQWYRYI